MLDAFDKWLDGAVLKIFPYAVLGLLYFLIHVLAKVGDSITEELNIANRELQAIREAIERTKE